MTSSEAELLEYESNAAVDIFGELINQWEDCSPYPGRSPKRSWYSLVVYTEEKVKAVLRFHAVWDEVLRSTPDTIDRIADFFVMPEWQRLRSAAMEALGVFEKRGKLPEDVEVTG